MADISENSEVSDKEVKQNGGRTIGIVVAIIVIVVIVGLLIWWCVSKNDQVVTIDTKYLKCLKAMQKSLDKVACLTRLYVEETFTTWPGKCATREAIVSHYMNVFTLYTGCEKRATSLTNNTMLKYAQYDLVISSPKDIDTARCETRRINDLIAAELVLFKCEHNSKVVGILNRIDDTIFEQIVNIQNAKYPASLDALCASEAAFTAFFKWLTQSYLRHKGVKWEK